MNIQAPPGGFQNGGWYWNPDIGQAQRYLNGSFLPPGQVEPGKYLSGQEPQTTTTNNGSNGVTTAEDIIKPVADQLKEQVTFLKDFLDKTPLAFDKVLVTQMEQEKFKPYYQQVLNDFVNPLQTKISQSTADETRLIGELVRRQEVGSRQIKDTTEQAINTAREGFAGAGLLGSGIEGGVTGRANIAGTNKLSDFTAGNQFQQTQTTLEQQRAREDAQRLIDQKNRDIFGQGQAYDTSVAQGVETARGTALKNRGISTLTAISDRFGQALPDIPNYLNLYNA